MERVKRIAAAIAAILLIFALVGGIISAIVISIPVKTWPVWVVIPLLVFFAWRPAIYTIKQFIDIAISHDEIYKGR